MIHFDHESVGGFMRGRFLDPGGLFSHFSPEPRVPAKHPLRQVRELVRAVLKDLSPSFGKLYSSAGRPSIPPEQLLSALLLQVFYGIRSERQLMGNSSTIIFCIAGSPGLRRTTLCGTRRLSPRTGIDCSTARCFKSS